MNLIWLTDASEADIAALRQLAKHQLGDRATIQKAIVRKQQAYRDLLEELNEIEQILANSAGA